jgi:hypothetical protein
MRDKYEGETVSLAQMHVLKESKSIPKLGLTMFLWPGWPRAQGLLLYLDALFFAPMFSSYAWPNWSSPTTYYVGMPNFTNLVVYENGVCVKAATDRCCSLNTANVRR